MYAKIFSMGIFCLIVGCIFPPPTNGKQPSSENYKTVNLPPEISKIFLANDETEKCKTDDNSHVCSINCRTDDGSDCFTFEQNEQTVQCDANKRQKEGWAAWVQVSCEKEFSKTNPVLLKIPGFDDIRLPLETDELNKKRFSLYTKRWDHLLKISFPITAFSSDLCIYTSTQGDVCAKEMTLEKIVNSEKQPIEMEFSPLLGNDLPETSSVSPETSDDVRGDYKLIVVSLSNGFKEKSNKIDTIIQESFKKWLDDLSKDNQHSSNKPFTLLVITSGRGLTEILTSEELTQLDESSIRQRVESRMSFTAQDLRPMDDLELVDELIKNYERQHKPVGRILYITNDDGFGSEIPRNQCMPLAWNRDKIQLQVLTRQSCDIWEKYAQLNKTNQCRELAKIIPDKKGRQLKIDALVKVFNDFLAE